MPIRFSTQAANADKIDPHRADRVARTPDGRAQVPREAESQAPGERTEGQPGKDINAAGFTKDQDAPKP